MTSYAIDLAKTCKDIAALEALSERDGRDPEKRVRLAYRQFHKASLTGDESDFKFVKETISGALRDFGPKEDICLLKANLDGHFHLIEEVKRDIQICPTLARRYEGRSILADVDFQEGRYKEARAALECLIRETRSWDALARLAHWKGKMGLADEADHLYEEAEHELTAKEMRCFSWLELQRGALSASHERYDKARMHYQWAANAFPGHWLTDEYMARLLAAEGRLDEAAAMLRDVIARTPKPELKQALAQILVSMGKAEEAKPWFDAAMAVFLASAQEGAVHYYHHLSEMCAGSKKHAAEAVKWARKDVALRPNFSAQAALASALFQDGEVAEAAIWIREALSSGVRDSGIFTVAASIYRAEGNTVEGDYCSSAAAEINTRVRGIHLHHH